MTKTMESTDFEKWAIRRSFWGQGLAIEAARAVKKMATSFLPDTRLISLIISQNEPSIRLAKAMGARFEREIPFRGMSAHIFRHSKENV